MRVPVVAAGCIGTRGPYATTMVAVAEILSGSLFRIDQSQSIPVEGGGDYIAEVSEVAHVHGDAFCVIVDEVCTPDCIDQATPRYAKWEPKWFADPWDRLKCLLVQWHIDDQIEADEALEYANRFVAQMRVHQLKVEIG